MQQEEMLYPPTLNDIMLDELGQVVVNDPEINHELMAAAAKPKVKKPTTAPKPDLNSPCTVNNASGCGVKKTAQS